MSIKEDIEKTYRKFDKIFSSQLGKPLKDLQMSQVRDQFKQWIYDEDPLFQDASHAEDSFLYIYHFTELQEIKAQWAWTCSKCGFVVKRSSRKFRSNYFHKECLGKLKNIPIIRPTSLEH